MSVAEIGSAQAFSEFKGFDRRLAVLHGEGLALTIEGQEHALTTTDAPLLFDGGADIRCRVLEKPIQVFNLMLPRGLAPVEMARVTGQAKFKAAQTCVVAVYAHDGGGMAQLDHDCEPIMPFRLLWRTAEAGSEFLVTADNALWMAFPVP